MSIYNNVGDILRSVILMNIFMALIGMKSLLDANALTCTHKHKL